MAPNTAANVPYDFNYLRYMLLIDSCARYGSSSKEGRRGLRPLNSPRRLLWPVPTAVHAHGQQCQRRRHT
eukprot:677836-Pleurochrysis_carterae.AAC.1